MASPGLQLRFGKIPDRGLDPPADYANTPDPARPSLGPTRARRPTVRKPHFSCSARLALFSGNIPENKASLALHEKCGFRTVGRRARVGPREGRAGSGVFA